MLGSGGGSGGAGADTAAVSEKGLLLFVGVVADILGPDGSEDLLIFHLIADLDPILATQGRASEDSIHVPRLHKLEGNTVNTF